MSNLPNIDAAANANYAFGTIENLLGPAGLSSSIAQQTANTLAYFDANKFLRTYPGITTTILALLEGITEDVQVALTNSARKNAANIFTDTNTFNNSLLTASNIGAASTGVTVVEYGDGRNHVTVLTIAKDLSTPTAGGNSAHAMQLYEFPAGVHSHKTTYMSIECTCAGATTDTPVVGIGSTSAEGQAIAVLNGTATYMDYITEQTAADCNGTATVKLAAATAGYGTGISLNESGDEKSIFLNIADGWDALVTSLSVAGTVVIEWTTLV